MKNLLLILLASILLTNSLEAQDTIIKHRMDIGVGLGCDYSGLGVKLSYLPSPYFSVFASGGYAMFELAWNVGASYHILPKTSEHRIRPHIKAMYGYNEIIYLLDAKEYNETYYGFTPGIGIEIGFGESRNHGFDFDLNFPFRSEEFKNDFEELDDNPEVNIKEPWPVAFALGYHFEF